MCGTGLTGGLLGTRVEPRHARISIRGPAWRDGVAG